MNAAPDAASRVDPFGNDVPGCQPEARNAVEERGERDRRLDRPEQAEGAREHPTVEEVPPGEWLLERVLAGRLRTERERREHVRTDVEREDLEDADGERDRAAGEGPHHERGELRDVVGEVVREEAPDVEERGAPLLDRGDDRRELVVEQDEVGGFACDVGPRRAHRDPDRRFAQRRRVVHAVAGHRDDVTADPQCARDAQLLLG